MQLILEEDGETRRFKLNDGTLTVGSAESCTLTVASEDVAEVHLELRVSDGEVVVAPRKGVAPVKIAGVALKGPRKLSKGQRVKFGSASLRTEEPGAKASGSGKAGVSKATGPRASGGGSRSTVQRRARQTHGKGLPTWAILLLIVPVLLIGYKLFVSFGEGTSERGFSAKASQQRIETAIAEGDYKTAEDEFKKIDSQEDLSSDWKAVFDSLRGKLATNTSAGTAAADNTTGTKYLDSQLKKYETSYLSKNERPRARVFVNRADYFLKRWPNHPEVDWVKRMKTQYSAVGRMTEPANLEDVTWEAKTLTWAYPANYRRAFQILRDFEASAEPAEATVARGLISNYELEEKTYFDERIDLAAGRYEDGAKKQALGYCLELVKGLNDPTMIEDAAKRVTKMAGVENALQAIQRDRPDEFQQLAENATLKAFFKKIGLL